MKRIAEVVFLAVLCLRAASADARQVQRSDPGLTVVSTSPHGEVASLAEANEIRVVFSEPMVSLGRIPADVRPPFFGSHRRCVLDTTRPGDDLRLQSVEICALSGMAANSWCPTKRREWIPSEESLKPCAWHHLTDEGLLTIFPPEYQQWAKDHTDAPVTRASDVATVHQVRELHVNSLRISSPPDGATYLIDPTLRREFQSLPLRAVMPSPGPLESTVDRRSLGTSTADTNLEWPLAPGRHTFVARDADGRSAESTVTVR